MHQRGEDRDAALDSIYMACTETKIYAIDYDRTRCRNIDKERDLARLWKKASIKVRHFDGLLADICYYKGEYWLDPEHWNQDDVLRLKIDLDKVILEAKDLKAMDDNEYEQYKLRKGVA